MRSLHVVLGVALLLAVSVFDPRDSHAADFPNKTVRIVIPFSAGGAPDVLLRILVPHLSEKWKQPVVVENRSGANTNIGTVVVTKAEPDGPRCSSRAMALSFSIRSFTRRCRTRYRS